MFARATERQIIPERLIRCSVVYGFDSVYWIYHFMHSCFLQMPVEYIFQLCITIRFGEIKDAAYYTGFYAVNHRQSNARKGSHE
jgi:hypothetical protein